MFPALLVTNAKYLFFQPLLTFVYLWFEFPFSPGNAALRAAVVFVLFLTLAALLALFRRKLKDRRPDGWDVITKSMRSKVIMQTVFVRSNR